MKILNYQTSEHAKEYGFVVGAVALPVIATATIVAVAMERHHWFLYSATPSAIVGGTVAYISQEQLADAASQIRTWVDRQKAPKADSEKLEQESFELKPFVELESLEQEPTKHKSQDLQAILRALSQDLQATLRAMPIEEVIAIASIVIPSTLSLAVGYHALVVGKLAFPRLVALNSGVTTGTVGGFSAVLLAKLTLEKVEGEAE